MMRNRARNLAILELAQLGLERLDRGVHVQQLLKNQQLSCQGLRLMKPWDSRLGPIPDLAQ